MNRGTKTPRKEIKPRQGRYNVKRRTANVELYPIMGVGYEEDTGILANSTRYRFCDDMRALRPVGDDPTPKASLLCRLLRWDQLEAKIFLGSFGLRGLLTVTQDELASLGLPGTQVQVLQQLIDQLKEPAPLPGPFRNSRQIFDAYRDFFYGRNHELFLLLLLNGKNRVMRDEIISEGSLTASLVHPREVFTPAVRHSAASVICLHNHPSGDPEPSAEDHQITQRLVECGNLLGVRVLDHIIVGDGCYFSFLDRGQLAPGGILRGCEEGIRG